MPCVAGTPPEGCCHAAKFGDSANELHLKTRNPVFIARFFLEEVNPAHYQFCNFAFKWETMYGRTQSPIQAQ
jgi:hypothetical protein